MPLSKCCANRLAGVDVRMDENCCAADRTVQRAQPLLGTLVTIRVRVGVDVCRDQDGLGHVHKVMDQAFRSMQEIERVMSAHSPDSDLARLARVAPGDEILLSEHTVAVLRLAKYWNQTSLGAFDPVLAANRLSRLDMRPAFRGVALAPQVTLRELSIVSGNKVRLERPMRLDLGGIAKGYAVDRAIAVLATGGIEVALVNAGGDLRASGEWGWPVAIRSPDARRHTRHLEGLRRLRNSALATSTGGPLNGEFVPAGRARLAHEWTSCSVHAPDCVTADALTKWGLQSPTKLPRLKRILRLHGASLWRY